jgi:HSP20 family protein
MSSQIATRRRTEEPLARLRNKVNTLFESFMTGWPAALELDDGLDRVWGLDLEEEGDKLVVRAEMPGFDASELDLQLSGRSLTIKAEKKQENKKDGNQGREERYISYRRSIMLPEEINPDKAEAKYENGVLEVRLPKSEQAKTKQIPVKA